MHLDQTLLLHPGDGLILVGSKGRIDHLDPGAQQWLQGAQAGDRLDDHWPELAAELTDQLAQGLNKTGAAATIVGIEIEHRGQPQAVRLFRSDTGIGVILALGVAEVDEVHDQRILLLDALVHHARDAILITTAQPLASPGPVIIYANQAFLEQTGYSLQEVLGRSPRLFQGAETNPATLQQFGQQLRNWQAAEMEVLNYRRDGSTYWTELKAVPLANRAGWISHWVSVQRDTSARLHLEASLREQACRDPITGLPNRRALQQELDEVLAALGPGRPQIGLLFCDLDRFKDVNDRFGHGAGDRLLVEISRRMQAALRSSDTLARLGGDEFVVLARDLEGRADALALAERLQQRLSLPWTLNGEQVVPSVSIGVVVTDDPTMDREELLRRADLTMYAAKASGRDRVSSYSRGLDRRQRDASSLRQRLQQAISSHNLSLDYQPVVRIGDGEAIGMEALVRFRNQNDNGWIGPEQFLPLAEHSQLIIDLDGWVMERALHTMAGQAAAAQAVAAQAVPHEAAPVHGAGEPLGLWLKVSPTYLVSGQLAQRLLQQIQAAGLAPERITLEVSRSVLIDDLPAARSELLKLQQAGLKIALDNLGGPSSSLHGLVELPIEIVKIDQRLVAALGQDRRSTALLTGLLGSCLELGLEVVAEGVETEDQRQQLIALGCSLAQGSLFGRPTSAWAEAPAPQGL